MSANGCHQRGLVGCSCGHIWPEHLSGRVQTHAHVLRLTALCRQASLLKFSWAHSCISTPLLTGDRHLNPDRGSFDATDITAILCLNPDRHQVC